MPATAPNPKKKAAKPKSGPAAKPASKTAAKKPVKKSNFILGAWKDKLIVHPDFFEPHERPENWLDENWPAMPAIK